MMTIEQMVNYLERRGFEVKKHWLKDSKGYQFTITKDGIGAISMYEWKPECTPYQVEVYQRDFLRRLVYLWEEHYDYCRHEKTVEGIEDGMIKQALNSIYGVNTMTGMFYRRDELRMKTITTNPKIKDVIFNDPATIVFWSDNTKTVVKCQDGDIYDPEKGLAMAICKKFFGNKGNYCNEINKWMDKYEEQAFNPFQEALDKICESVRQAKLTIPKMTTALDKLKTEHPNEIDQEGMAMICPHVHGYLSKPDNCGWGISCEECWNREIPAEPEQNKE